MKIFPVVQYLLFTSKLCLGEGIPNPFKEPTFTELTHGLEKMPADTVESKKMLPSYGRITPITPREEGLIRRMVQYSAATYCFDTFLKPWECRPCKKLENVEIISLKHDPQTGGKAFYTVDHYLRTVVVAFRGSSNRENWETNMKLALVDLDVGDGTSGIQVHKGFLIYSTAMSKSVLPVVKLLVAKYNYTLTLTGHSLGGAVAALASITLKNELKLPWSRITLVTFGSPRVGNKQFAKWMNSHNANILRVVNKGDLVPHVPSFSSGFVHYRQEIFIEDKIQSCTSPALEDANCANSRIPDINILDHGNYLNVSFAKWC